MAITYEPYVKTGDNTYEEIKLPYNVLSDAPDLSEYVTKSGEETISGVKIFSSAPKMDTLENSRGNAMYHFNGSKVYFGQTTFPITLRGNGVRPKYLQNGDESELALYNDLLNYVPAQSGDGTYYSQVENENGEVSLRTFKNGDTTDTASVRVKKDGTVVLQGTVDRPQYQKGGDSAVDIALFSGSHADSDTGKVAVVDSDGLIYYRTPVEVANDGVKKMRISITYPAGGTLSDSSLEKIKSNPESTIIQYGFSELTRSSILTSAYSYSNVSVDTTHNEFTIRGVDINAETGEWTAARSKALNINGVWDFPILDADSMDVGTLASTVLDEGVYLLYAPIDAPNGREVRLFSFASYSSTATKIQATMCANTTIYTYSFLVAPNGKVAIEETDGGTTVTIINSGTFYYLQIA